MSHIYLVRHGQDEDNVAKILNGHRDMPLTELGRDQAQTTAEKLKDNNIDVVYCSPLQRAKETAQIIAKTLHLAEPTVLPELIERDFGVLTGKPVSDIPQYASGKILKTENVDYFLEVEGAEDFPTTYARAEGVLDAIKQKHPDENVVLVTHGDTGKMIRAAYHKWTWEEGLKTPYFANTEVLELAPHDRVE